MQRELQTHEIQYLIAPHSQAMSEANHFTSLCLSVLTCKVRVMGLHEPPTHPPTHLSPIHLSIYPPFHHPSAYSPPINHSPIHRPPYPLTTHPSIHPSIHLPSLSLIFNKHISHTYPLPGTALSVWDASVMKAWIPVHKELILR